MRSFVAMTPCIEASSRTKGGYGRVTRDGKQRYAHRVAWEEAHGPIPEGMQVLHHCDNPPCFNVEHLFLGTHRVNMEDMAAKGRGRPGNRKITAEQLPLIRARVLDGESQSAVARSLGVHPSLICRLVR